jgi:hypothetical protein
VKPHATLRGDNKGKKKYARIISYTKMKSYPMNSSKTKSKKQNKKRKKRDVVKSLESLNSQMKSRYQVKQRKEEGSYSSSSAKVKAKKIASTNFTQTNSKKKYSRILYSLLDKGKRCKAHDRREARRGFF